MKYRITEDDLKKRNYTSFSNLLNADFLAFIKQEEAKNSLLFKNESINKLEQNTKRDINTSIGFCFVFGSIALALGLYYFFKYEPRIAVNLYTQMPLIENGSFAIVFGIALILGGLYSFIKYSAILETKVKSKIIEQLKKEQQDQRLKTSQNVSKKRKRFRQKFTGHKKKRK